MWFFLSQSLNAVPAGIDTPSKARNQAFLSGPGLGSVATKQRTGLKRTRGVTQSVNTPFP
jgi:hypothetical protein